MTDAAGVARYSLPGGSHELTVRSGIAYVGPAIRGTWSPRLRAALERRRDASLTGACACGGAIAGGRPLAPRRARVTLEHEPDCDAGDDRLAELLTAEGLA